MSDDDVVRVANCSGFFGDRLSAAREVLDGGPIDVLTGDWLAELTMGVLAKGRARDPQRAWARTFLAQLQDVLPDCLERGVRIVSNAGGLDPAGCAAAVSEIAASLGVSARVAYVTGDDVTELVAARRADGWEAPHIGDGAPVPFEPAVANAYIGCWGIVEALERGADVVVCGRVSDASPVVAAAAWKFGWARDDWDAIAGAVAAGHVIECGAQATGGNFSGFQDIEGIERAGFPIAEIARDGSAVITKHPGTGGAVTRDTVTAQLLYEIDGPRYLSPDAVSRFDTISLEDLGGDRVRMSGVRGEPAPPTLKTGLVCMAGFRNSVTFVLAGLDIEAKAALAERALWARVPGGAASFERTETRLVRADRPDPQTIEDGIALLTVSVADPDQKKVAGFARGGAETALSSYPGMHPTAPPGPGSAYSVFWPTLLPATDISHRVTFEGETWDVAPPPSGADFEAPPLAQPPAAASFDGETTRAPIGAIAYARSGDKGPNATLGIWAVTDERYEWLVSEIDAARLRELLPMPDGCEVLPWHLPNLRAIGFTVAGLLGLGVAANLAIDPQAKGVGEHVRARLAEIPASLL